VHTWLNMVEIEIGVLKQQCLSRRISERDTLVREIATWQKHRNETAPCSMDVYYRTCA
jgi:hypothetical protein